MNGPAIKTGFYKWFDNENRWYFFFVFDEDVYWFENNKIYEKNHHFVGQFLE